LNRGTPVLQRGVPLPPLDHRPLHRHVLGIEPGPPRGGLRGGGDDARPRSCVGVAEDELHSEHPLVPRRPRRQPQHHPLV
jgi:hypothetical protein